MSQDRVSKVLTAHKIQYQFAIPFNLPAHFGKGFYLSQTNLDLNKINYVKWRQLKKDLAELNLVPMIIPNHTVIDLAIDQCASTLTATDQQSGQFLGEMAVNQKKHKINDKLNTTQTLSELIQYTLFFHDEAIEFALSADWLPTTNIYELQKIVMSAPLSLDAIEQLYDNYLKPIFSSKVGLEDLIEYFDKEFAITKQYCPIQGLHKQIINEILDNKIKDRFELDHYLLSYEYKNSANDHDETDALNDAFEINHSNLSYVLNDEQPVLLLLPLQDEAAFNAFAVLAFHHSSLIDHYNIPAAMLIRYLTTVHKIEFIGFPATSMFFYCLFEKPINDLKECYRLTVLAEKIFSEETMNCHGVSCRTVARARNELTQWVLGSSAQ